VTEPPAAGGVAARPERPRRLVALTFDYETWQPIPQGKRIDWEADVFSPADRLIAGDVPVTFFAELGEYFWLDESRPALARRMEEQWREAIRHGHDVQLHLHPSWLPECGATQIEGEWHWDQRYAKADAYPGDLDALLQRCVARLHDVLQPADHGYRVTCFRAGAYQAQPFRRLSAALARAGVRCDSSVYAGGISDERGYDYSDAYSDAQPYFASPWDPQLPAAPAEEDLIELPIAVIGGRRVMLDGNEGARLETRIARRRSHVPRRLRDVFVPSRSGPTTTHDYTVAIGHTKGDPKISEILTSARRLADRGYELVTLSTMAEIARRDLLATRQGNSLALRSVPDDPRTERLYDLVPLDRERVLVLDDGTEHASLHLARTYPWMQVQTADAASFAGEPLPTDRFDCVFADRALATVAAVDATLREANEVLREGGVLVAAIPSSRRGGAAVAYAWQTVPADVRARMEAAGFVDVEIDLAHRRMMFVRAWKRDRPATQLDRAREAMGWLYSRLEPGPPTAANDALEVIGGGVALCAGYALALQELLRREDVESRIVEMEATEHPRGRGSDHIDTHVVVQALLDERWFLLDAMAGTVIPHSLAEILEHPDRAAGRADPDTRHASRGYALYDTAFWYSRVARYRVYRSKLSRWQRNRQRAPVG
jgi:SAM-dependent methyltransferase